MTKPFTALLLSLALVAPTAAHATPPPIAPTRVAAGPTAAEVVVNVQAFYAGVGQVSAKFRQEVVNVTFGNRSVSDGFVAIKKPGNMRWRYVAKKRRGKATLAKEFISNGSYLYVVDYENKQVIAQDLQKNLLPAAVTFLYGKGDLAADFTPSLDASGTYGGTGDLVLRLVPKAPSAQYKTLHLVVDPSNYRVKQSIIVDAAGNTNHFSFYEPDFTTPIKDSDFQFNAKSPRMKSFRVIDGN